MRSILFALALLTVAPAQATITYQFSGTCTSSYLQGGVDADLPECLTFVKSIAGAITLPDNYTPGTEFNYGEQEAIFWLPVVGWLPESSGPGSLFFDFGVGVFQAQLDGVWSFRSEFYSSNGFTPFYANGTEATFTRVGIAQVPLPGTLVLLGAGALILAARRR